MDDAAPIADRDQVILAELAELGLELAYSLQRRAQAAEDEAMAGLARAFHVVGRSVRQSLALKAKLAADRARQRREACEAARAETVRRVARRAEQVRAAVTSLIWTEAERPDAEELEQDLEALIEVDSVSDDFLAAPLPEHVARIAGDLGLILPDEADGDAGPSRAADPFSATPREPWRSG